MLITASVISEEIEGKLLSLNAAPLTKPQPIDISELIIKCRIDLTEILSPPPVAMSISSTGEQITLFTKGNFSIVTGAAKSRKTFLISMLVAAAICGHCNNMFFCSSKGVTLIFDTEQSRYKSQQIAKRICHLSGKSNPDNFQMYSLRTLDPSERIDLIEKVLETTPNINFVAIDGIIDLEVDPILQADQAQHIVSKLMKWTENYNIHIVCVLHFNKSVTTLLGHLGSFSHRKADAIISVTKSKDDPGISLVEPVDCREKEFMPFAFSVDDKAIPYILEDHVFDKQPKITSKTTKEVDNRKNSPYQFTALQHEEFLKDVFATSKELGYEACWRNIKNSIEKIANERLGDNVAKGFHAYYLNNQNIIKIETSKKKPVYIFPLKEGL